MIAIWGKPRPSYRSHRNLIPPRDAEPTQSTPPDAGKSPLFLLIGTHIDQGLHAVESRRVDDAGRSTEGRADTTLVNRRKLPAQTTRSTQCS